MMDPELRDCVDEERRLAAVNESLRKQRNEARAQRDACVDALNWIRGYTVDPAIVTQADFALAAVKGDEG